MEGNGWVNVLGDGLCLIVPDMPLFADTMSQSQPCVLKTRHSLVGKSVLPLIAKVKKSKALPQPVAQLKKGQMLSEVPIEQQVLELEKLTGHAVKELFELADKSVEEGADVALFLHMAIVMANEVGQPSTQVLRDLQMPQDSAQPGPSTGLDTGAAYSSGAGATSGSKRQNQQPRLHQG